MDITCVNRKKNISVVFGDFHKANQKEPPLNWLVSIDENGSDITI